VIFRDQGKAEQLDEVLSQNNFKPDLFRHGFKTCSEQSIPECKNNPVVAVMFLSERRVVRSVQGGRNDPLRQLALIGELEIGMVKQDKHQLNGFHGKDNVGIDTDQDDEQALEGDLDQEVKHVEAKSRGDVVDLIAVMDLVKAPEEIIVVIQVMPGVEREIVEEKSQDPAKGALIHAVKQPER